MSVRVGAVVPTTGENAVQPGVVEAARALERAGFDSLWVTDHIVMPLESKSVYPFSDDGKMNWPPRQTYLESISASAAIAAVTKTVELGIAVMVLPLRNPVTVAKQTATIDVLSGGRFSLGVGAGWLREEFDAIGVDFSNRGASLDEALLLIRRCWTGEPGEFKGQHYALPAGICCYPTPMHDIPLLIGGNSKQALERAALVGQGWLGLQRCDTLDVAGVAQSIQTIRDISKQSGGEPDTIRMVLRVIRSQTKASVIRAQLSDLEAAGVTDLIVDTTWDAPDAVSVAATLKG